MTQPVVGSGFGTFSRVVGPWTDYFPVQTLPADSQIGTAVATEIVGPATVGSLTLEPPANVQGTFATIPWRFLIVRGNMPKSLEPFQQALQGSPRVGAQDLPLPVLFEKTMAAQGSANNSTGGNTQGLHFPFPDMCGPSVGPGETMTCIFLLMDNETGVPGYGANNKTYVSFTVTGVNAQNPAQTGNADTKARSIPRGAGVFSR